MTTQCVGPRYPERPFAPGPPARLPCGAMRCGAPKGQPGPFPFPGRSIVEALPERDRQESPIERDGEILVWARAVNLSMRWAPVPMRSGLVVWVSADMVQMGGVRLCASMVTAQHLADLGGCILPTAGIVEAFHKAARVVVNPKPAGHCLPEPSQTYCNPGGAIEPWLEHQDRVQAAVEEADPGGVLRAQGAIVDTSGKDYVLGPYVIDHPTRCAIFGWIDKAGKVTQSPADGGSGGHELSYFDYSHRIMLVRRAATLNGQTVDLAEIYLRQPELVSRSGLKERIPARHPAIAPISLTSP